MHGLNNWQSDMKHKNKIDKETKDTKNRPKRTIIIEVSPKQIPNTK